MDYNIETQSTRHFPATFVELPPETEGRRAAFYLAAEEYIADRLPEGSYFMTWQVGPTVVMGRNQMMHLEVDVDFCHREGIDIIRRRSGGGAIFADKRNIMTSLITEDVPVETLFQEYAEAIAQALRLLGAPATVAGRNDIMLRVRGEERKVCGNAFYKKTNRCIAHGTMLYDTNPQLMEGALRPDIAKLESKGVKSVRSRIGLLKDYLSFNEKETGQTITRCEETFAVQELRRQLRQLLCDRTITLTDIDIHEIEQLEQRYYAHDFFYGITVHSDVVRSTRIPSCGQIELCFSLSGSLITGITLHGDFFDLDQAQEHFSQAFVDQPFTPESMRSAIHNHHPERSVRGLSEEVLISLVCN